MRRKRKVNIWKEYGKNKRRIDDGWILCICYKKIWYMEEVKRNREEKKKKDLK